MTVLLVALLMLVIGAMLGFFVGALMRAPADNDTWQEGFDDGVSYAIGQGYVMARNDSLDEIMVSDGDDISRYKRVTDVVE